MKNLGISGLAVLLWLAFLPVQAAMVSTADSADRQTAAPAMSAELRRTVERQLIERGVEPRVAAGRVARMTDRQVVALDGKLASLPAGGGMSTTNLLLIIIIIILLI